MKWLDHHLLDIAPPQDYFQGLGRNLELASLSNVLLFVRQTRKTLQQEALQNRSHHRFVLIINLETHGQIHINQRVFTLNPGQAMLVHPYQFHHFTQLASNTIQWLICTFELALPALAEPLRYRVVDLGDTSWAACRGMLVEWHSCLRDGGALQEGVLQVATLQLLMDLLRDASHAGPEDATDLDIGLIRVVNQFMQASHGQSVDVADLAAEQGQSVSRLRARFHAAAGVPLARYMRNHRLNYAMYLLRTTDLPIAEVAEDAGFGSPQAFSRLFKRKLGSTPRDYRKTPD